MCECSRVDVIFILFICVCIVILPMYTHNKKTSNNIFAMVSTMKDEKYFQALHSTNQNGKTSLYLLKRAKQIVHFR